MSNGVLSIEWAGEAFELHAERAVHWKRAATLIIADVHFGKAAAFRRAGVPVPAGTTQANLDRLTSLLAGTGARRLIVLGDFLHARAGRIEPTMRRIADWRDNHPGLEVILVRGNHDHNAGDPPSEWRFTCLEDVFFDLGFAFTHEGGDRAFDAPLFCGHVHPCAVLCDVDGSTLRAPCFHFSRRHAVLPAFGSFTGTHPIRPQEGDRIYAVGHREVIAVRGVPCPAS